MSDVFPFAPLTDHATVALLTNAVLEMGYRSPDRDWQPDPWLRAMHVMHDARDSLAIRMGYATEWSNSAPVLSGDWDLAAWADPAPTPA